MMRAPPAISAVPSAASCSSTIAIAVDHSGVVENSTCALAAGTRLCPCAVTDAIVAVHSHYTDTIASTLHRMHAVQASGTRPPWIVALQHPRQMLPPAQGQARLRGYDSPPKETAAAVHGLMC